MNADVNYLKKTVANAVYPSLANALELGFHVIQKNCSIQDVPPERCALLKYHVENVMQELILSENLRRISADLLVSYSTLFDDRTTKFLSGAFYNEMVKTSNIGALDNFDASCYLDSVFSILFAVPNRYITEKFLYANLSILGLPECTDV